MPHCCSSNSRIIINIIVQALSIRMYIDGYILSLLKHSSKAMETLACYSFSGIINILVLRDTVIGRIMRFIYFGFINAGNSI